MLVEVSEVVHRFEEVFDLSHLISLGSDDQEWWEGIYVLLLPLRLPDSCLLRLRQGTISSSKGRLGFLKSTFCLDLPV